MLMHLRSRIEIALAAAHEVTIATAGPAEIQITSVPCRAHGLTLFLLVPHTSDHLANLAVSQKIAVAGPGWRLHGQAQVLDCTAAEVFVGSRGDRWHSVVAVAPRRFEWLQPGGDCAAETVDIDDRARHLRERGRTHHAQFTGGNQ